jgi:hypothetical protein
VTVWTSACFVGGAIRSSEKIQVDVSDTSYRENRRIDENKIRAEARRDLPAG